MKSRHFASGFTLVEVLVASAIVISAIGVILQLFSSGMTGMHKAGHAQHMILVERQLYEQIQQLDLTQIRRGEGELSGVKFSWAARPQGEQFFTAADNNFEVISFQMYQVTVALVLEGRSPKSFEFKKLNYRAGGR
jgi:prepilin-type N-terminal cleavage/methylation domain-containing protein